MLRLVMDLHRLQIRRRDLAVRTLVLRVAAFLLARPVGEPRLSSASVGQRRVGLGLELLRRVLLRLRLACHRRLAAMKGGEEDESPNPNLIGGRQKDLVATRGSMRY